MRDLNHIYSEFLVRNTIRERQEQAQIWNRLVVAMSDRPSPLQRLASTVRGMRRPRQAVLECPPTTGCLVGDCACVGGDRVSTRPA